MTPAEFDAIRAESKDDMTNRITVEIASASTKKCDYISRGPQRIAALLAHVEALMPFVQHKPGCPVRDWEAYPRQLQVNYVRPVCDATCRLDVKTSVTQE